jgi:hypothetical protein
MANYKVISDNCTLGKQGDTISADDLDGVNVDALLDGGHLAEVNVKVLKQDTKEMDK